MTDTTQEKGGGIWALPGFRAFAPPPETPPQADVDAGQTPEIVPWGRPGTPLRVKTRAARRGLYAPAVVGAPSTTRQAQILNTAVIAPPTGTRGVVNGRDVLSRTSIAHDPVTAYNSEPREVSSPNSIVLGAVGSGKSSFVKTTVVLRPLLLKKRRAVVFDRKDQGGEGEYSNVVRRYGYEPIRFTTDGSGTTLNIMDPLIAQVSGVQGQYRLLNVIVRLAREDEALDEWEEEALRAALHRTAAQFNGDHGRAATLADLLPNLGTFDTFSTPDYALMSADARDKLHQAGLSVRFTLNGLLDEYAGLLDGETSKSVDLTGKLTSFDISQLPDEGPATPVVMAIGNMWMIGRMRAERGWRTSAIYEEGWHMVDGPIANLIRSNAKLSRGLGINNVFVMHKVADIPRDSPARSIIQEAQTVYAFRQDRPEDAQWCVDTFGFSPETVETLQQLRPGHCIFKFGANPETHIQHIRSDWETEVTNTDEGMAAGVDDDQDPDRP